MKAFKSIVRDFSLLAAIILLLVLGVSISSLFLNRQMIGDVRRTDLVGNARTHCLEIVLALNHAAHEERDEANRLVEFVLAEGVPKFEALLRSIKQGDTDKGLIPLEALHHDFLNLKFGEIVDQWQDLMIPLIRQAATEIQDHAAGRSGMTPDAGPGKQFQQTFPALKALDSEIQGFVDLIAHFSLELVHEYEGEQQMFFNIVYSSIAFMFLLLVGVTFWLRKRLITPILQINRSALQIADGNLQERVSIKNRDELGTLAASFNSMADSVSLSIIENKQLVKKLRSLNHAVNMILSVKEMNAFLSQVAEEIRQLTGARYAAIGIRRAAGDELEFYVPAGISQEEYEQMVQRHGIPKGKGLLGHLYKAASPIRVDDIANHPASQGFPVGHPQMTSFLGVPLILEGVSIGGLYLTDKVGAKHFSVQDEDLAIAFSSSVILALNNVRLYEDLKTRKEAVEIVNRIARAVSQSVRLEELLELALDEVMALQVLRLQNKAAIFLYNQETKGLELKAERGFVEEHHQACNMIEMGKCLCGLAAEKREIITSTNSAEDKRHTINYEGIVEHGHIILPLNIRDKLLGVLCLYLNPGKELTAKEIEIFKTISDIIAISINNALTFQEAERLAMAVNSSNDAVYISDMNGNFVYSNPMATKHVGFPKDELYGEHFSILFSDSNPKGLSEEVFHTSTISGWSGEIICGCKDGSEFPAYLTTAPVRDESGTVVYLVGLCKDITTQKEAEENLRKSEARLARAQAIAHLGSWEWNINANTLFWSDEIYRIFGLEPQQFVMTYEAFLDLVHHDDRQLVMKAIEAAIHERQPYSIDHRLVRDSDQVIRIVHEEAEITFDENGKPVILTGTVQDITERKLAEEELEKYRHHLEEIVEKRTAELEVARHQAEASNQAKSEFLANMSHELRTPLNAIIGFSDVLDRGMAGELSKEQKEYINDIGTSGKHLLSLINDILDLSKVEAGKMELDLSEFRLCKLVEQSLVMFKEKAMKHRIKLEVEGNKGLPPVTADERKIKQVVYNLLSNAMKFNQDGGSVVVGVQLLREGEEDVIEVSVSDTGIGIAPAAQKKLFQPFHQVDQHLSKKYEGTGLGLALCKSIIELHSGKIWVESEVDQGSTFIFRIPVRQDQTQGEGI